MNVINLDSIDTATLKTYASVFNKRDQAGHEASKVAVAAIQFVIESRENIKLEACPQCGAGSHLINGQCSYCNDFRLSKLKS